MNGRAPTLFVSVGDRFGRGVVINPEIRIPAKSHGEDTTARGARLKCDCGNVYETKISSLLIGDCKSCGCLRRGEPHGMSHHPLYGTWLGMLQRCERPQHKGFRWYGDRGIEVCERWHDVRLFIEDIEREIGPKPEGQTLDRTNNDGNYEPGNVRWRTPPEQIENARRGGRSPEERALLYKQIEALWNAGGWSYRRLGAHLGISEWTLRSIVDRLELTHYTQSQQNEKRDYKGLSPGQRAERRRLVQGLIAAGQSASQIATALGVTVGMVDGDREWLKARGMIIMKPPPS